MEYESHFWEYFLLVLKIVGIVGAFAGFAAEGKPDRAQGLPTKAFAYVFLSIAISAELCDSLLKVSGANEQAERFERLAHPLGIIRVRPFYSVDMTKDPSLQSYIQRVDRSRSLEVVPNKDTEHAAYALLNHSIFLDIFFYKKRRVPKPDDDVDMSLQFSIPHDLYVQERSQSPMGNNQERFNPKYYSYYRGRYTTIMPEIADDPTARYSNGAIVSTHDLLGSRIEIRFCPNVHLDDTEESYKRAEELQQLISFESINIDLPGRQEIEINARKNAPGRIRATIGPAKDKSCSLARVTMPETEEELRKIILP